VNRGARSLAAVAGHQRSWSKHELSYLDCAAKFFAANGTIVESDSGVTDEGDPWFVFWDKVSDEIVAHFARIDGHYIACVPFRDRAVTGYVLADLIDQFLWRHVAQSPQCGPRARSISIGVRPSPVA